MLVYRRVTCNTRKYLQVDILRSWARSAVLPALYSFYWLEIVMILQVAIAEVLSAGRFLHPVPGGGDRHLSEDPRPRERQASEQRAGKG
jgi:hypothetical protein